MISTCPTEDTGSLTCRHLRAPRGSLVPAKGRRLEGSKLEFERNDTAAIETNNMDTSILPNVTLVIFVKTFSFPYSLLSSPLRWKDLLSW
jgi:hypothetical protein